MAAEGKRLEIGVLYGFRAIMVLLVANFHFWQQSWLRQGITLFGSFIDMDYITRASYVFVDGMLLLSGFLLFLPHAQAMEEHTPVPGVKRFYMNRLIRILPSFVFAVLVALFCFALPQGGYANAGAMWLDILSHLTFTFTFFLYPYQFTPLNGVLWTVAIEMQLYLIFPLLAKAARRKPVLTLGLMTAAGWLYRLWVYYRVPDTAMFINQMPAFLDVYALGMLGAIGYLKLRRWFRSAEKRERLLAQVAAVAVLTIGIMMVLQLLRAQSSASVISIVELRLSQLRLRLPLALALMASMLGAAFAPKVIQWLFSNRLMRFFSAISFNFYIWHQILAVQMARNWFPSTLHESPGLQYAFTTLCYCVGLAAAMAATYGLEQPIAKRINQWIRHRERKLST